MTAFENATSFTDALGAADTLSGGFLMPGFAVVVWLVIFGYTLNHGRGQAITTASFTTSILVFLMNFAGLVDYWLVIASLVTLALGFMSMILERRND